MAFNRSLTLIYPEREISMALKRHKGEILAGAAIAKAQMDANIDGETPNSGLVGGPLPIRAGYLGIGDDWEDLDSFSTGEAQNWIHSGTTLLGGSGGSAVRVGGNAVHVIIGIRSRHPSPKTESVKNEINGKEKPTLTTAFAQKASGDHVAFKELDDAIILKENDTLLSKIFASATYGSTVEDYLELVGASFIPEAQVRVQDPEDLCGTSDARDVNDVVRTT